MNMAAIVWLVLMVVFLAAEASTVSMVSLWFAAGALIALLTALAGGPAWLQTLLFLAVSAGLLLALRPLVKKYQCGQRGGLHGPRDRRHRQCVRCGAGEAGGHGVDCPEHLRTAHPGGDAGEGGQD